MPVTRLRALAAGLMMCCGVAASQNMDFEAEYHGYSWREIIGFYPYFGAVDLAYLPSGHLLVAQKAGVVSLLNANGQWQRYLLDLTSEVSDYGDGGLTAILLDPEFETSPWIYLLYAVDPDPANPDTTVGRFARLTRYQINTGTLTIRHETRQVLLGETWGEGIIQESGFHNTDGMDWGDDGSLLLSAGDGSATLRYQPGYSTTFGPDRFDPSLDIGSLRAQSLNCYNGKVLRLDRNTGLGLPSNPFYTGNGNDPQSRIWIYGLRNPWRFSVLRGTGSHNPADGRPGALWIGDVGLDTYEELNISSRTGGDNFGWPFYEGPFSPFDQATYDGPIPWVSSSQVRPYAAAFGHSTTSEPSLPSDLVGAYQANSITGGVFYDYKESVHRRGGGRNHVTSPYSSVLDGKYIFADWATQKLFIASIDAFDQITSIGLVATGPLGLSDHGIVDLSYSPYTGTIYALTYWRLYKLEYDPAGAPPVASVSATPDAGALPLQATLDASASYDPAGKSLTYTWEIDDGTSGVTSVPQFTHTFTENRNHQVRVTVTTQDNRQSSAETTVYAGNLPPVVKIRRPLFGTSYPDDGSTVSIYCEATATDPDGTTEPQSRWRLVLRHNDHRHEIEEAPGLTAYFTVSDQEENTFFLFEFFATDERGYTVMDSVPVYRFSDVPLSAAEGEWSLYE